MKKHLSIILGVVVLISLIIAIVFVKMRPEQPSALALPIAGEYAENVTVQTDIRYSEDVHQGYLDIAYQKNNTSKPLLIFVHGGYWISGKKEEMDHLMYTFSSRGYVTASIEYDFLNVFEALAGNCHSINDEERDINKAVEYLVNNAAAYEIDTNKIVFVGHSAGAQLVGNLTEKIVADPSQYSYIPTALVMLAPPSDLKQMVFSNASIANGQGSIVQCSFAFDGVYGADVMDEIEKVDVLYNLTEALPPTLIVQGLRDNLVSPAISEALFEKMIDLGIKVELKELSNADHQLIRNEEVNGALDIFLNTYVSGKEGE